MRPIGSMVPRDLQCVSALVALALMVACGDPVPVATTITVLPVSAYLEDSGDTAYLTATVLDQDGNAMTDIPVSWTSGDSVIATVSGDGLVTGVAAGVATVQASAEKVTGEAMIQVKPGPAAVLQRLYLEMGGDGWDDNTNWRTDAPVHTWHGVDAAYTKPPWRITGLSLERNGLTGTIPPELGALQTLRFLDFHDNRVTGSLPPELGFLHSLFWLWVDGNQLTGAIPPEYGNLGSLRHLYLGGNRLTGSIPPELGKLDTLETLVLRDNQLTGSIPAELGELPALRTLYLSGNGLTGPIPAELGNLRELTSLSVFGNPLSGRLPRELIGLSLKLFHWHDTGLCAPADVEFQEWLDSIKDHSGNGNCES